MHVRCNISFAKTMNLYCKFCSTDLWHEHTYIKCTADACAKLGISICLQCFATGAADDIHKNNDPYKVLCNAVKTSDQSWLAHEEMMLLDTFMDTMSWEKVAQKLGRSPKECEHYYFENFVDNPKIKELEEVNKIAFRLDTLENVIEDRTINFGDISDVEGI